jgi:hypothetical protein
MKCIQRYQGFQRQLTAGRSNGLHELRARINQDVVDNCQVGEFQRHNQVEPANQVGVFYTASSRIILKLAYSAIGIREVPSRNQISCTQRGGTQATRAAYLRAARKTLRYRRVVCPISEQDRGKMAFLWASIGRRSEDGGWMTTQNGAQDRFDMCRVEVDCGGKCQR